jgi:hypothetical protein
MRRSVGQPKRLAMQPRPSATRVLLGTAIHHAVFGQAHQEVGIDRVPGEGFQIVAAVERHHRPRRVCRLGATDRRDLVQRHLRRRPRRRSTPSHLERYDPAASRLRHGD